MSSRASIAAFLVFLSRLLLAFEPLDTVVVKRETAVSFNSNVIRHAQAGEKIVVYLHNRTNGLVYFFGTATDGTKVALNIRADDLRQHVHADDLMTIEGRWERDPISKPDLPSIIVYDKTYGKMWVGAINRETQTGLNMLISSGLHNRVKITGDFPRDRWGRVISGAGPTIFSAETLDDADKENPDTITLIKMLVDPSVYLDRIVTVKGDFLSHETERKAFYLLQGSQSIAVFYKNLDRSEWAKILKLEAFSHVPISVSGRLLKFGDSENSYYIDATSFEFQQSAP
jgi:hypothetical protein